MPTRGGCLRGRPRDTHRVWSPATGPRTSWSRSTCPASSSSGRPHSENRAPSVRRAFSWAAFHAQARTTDDEYEARENAKVLRNLDEPHRIPPDVEATLRAVIGSWPTESAVVVPTHGDWSTRNWLVDAGTVRVIDFGRAALRPAVTDWLRLSFRDFRDDPVRESAFVEGYGSDPRDPHTWSRERLREAVNTAVWAYRVGDEKFESEGHEWIGRALEDV